MFQKRKRYYKHIISMIMSVAAVIVLQCMSQSIIPMLFSSTKNNSDFSLITFRCETQNDNTNTEIISEPELTSEINKHFECFPIINETICRGEFSTIKESIDIEAVTDGFWLESNLEMCSESPFINSCWQTDNAAAVISNKTATTLFGDSNACRKKIFINTAEYGVIEFTVCGVYVSDKNTDIESNEIIYVNLNFMNSHYHVENKQYEEITYAISGKPDNDTLSQILIPLNIASADKSVRITVRNDIDEDNAESGFVSLIMNILLSFAVIAFFLSNIIILNMTFIMVGRRTREIGIRKAVGGQTHDIRLQIIAESTITAMAGNLIGILSGLLTGNLIIFASEKFAMHGEVPFELCIPLKSIVISATGTILLSTLLALLPADIACRMTVTDAIRHRE